MQVGDLVRYRLGGDFGIILEVSETSPCGVMKDYYVYWVDGCRDWNENEDLEVING